MTTHNDQTLVNEVGLPLDNPTSRLNEQARSGAECKEPGSKHCVCPSSASVDESGGAGGGASPSPSPYFLVPNKTNVNAQLRNARGLLAMWDFLEHKGRIGRTNILLKGKDDYKNVKIMPASCKSRYFDDGRLNIAYKIAKRLGKHKKVPGLMQTLTYDPKKIGKRGAWASFSKDVRRYLNSVNQYRRRRGWDRLHYFWIVEVQKGTGYPHVHIFFPRLKWLVPMEIINSNWGHGRANIESSKSLNTNCVGYICKYLTKMESWRDLHLTLLWKGKCRMYGFSRSFAASVEKQESEWGRWCVVETKNIQQLITNLKEGGFRFEDD